MLNWIWLSIILIAVAVAVGTDVTTLSENTYRNGEEFTATHEGATLIAPRADIEKFYGKNFTGADTFRIPIKISGAKISLALSGEVPAPLRGHAKAQGDEKNLSGIILRREEHRTTILFDNVYLPTVNTMVNDGIIAYAKKAVELAIGLIGIMCVWLGVMKIAEHAGLVERLARVISPAMKKIFPDVPANHPAMGAMMMNIAANVLGLGNAATPLGLKAMEELSKLNKHVGTATNAMCTFLVINTSSVQLIPATVIAIRASSGAHDPTDILGIVLLVTTINTTVGIVAAKFLERRKMFQVREEGTA